MDETRQQKQAGRKKRVGRGVKYKRLPLLSAKREAPFPCLGDLISLPNISSLTVQIRNCSASFLSTSDVALLDRSTKPFTLLAQRLSLTIAFTALFQSENLYKRSDRNISSFTLIARTCALLSSGSPLSTSSTLIYSLGSSLCQRKLGPVNQITSVPSQ